MKRKSQDSIEPENVKRHRYELYVRGWLTPESTTEVKQQWDSFMMYDYPKIQREWRRILRH